MRSRIRTKRSSHTSHETTFAEEL
ncbi:hypothetical protein B4U80_09147 [Leptotrombidium deliense]|uniref:Uncharacterized protein n=1 Tax=Leptotrombidium deliense TaxID=299467 RepID=A0A443SEF0_9ACAR|nr:hypothetical protein B4U80_09147 [Leptotrombidium deliense]